MNTEGLMRITDRLKIPVFDFKTRNKKAYCVQNEIVMDFQRIECDREGKQLLSEEIGHVFCDAFYPLCYCCDQLKAANIMKQECKAHRCSIRLQVPLYELKNALSKTSDDYEIAEILDVDIQTLQEAVEYYKLKELL